MSKHHLSFWCWLGATLLCASPALLPPLAAAEPSREAWRLKYQRPSAIPYPADNLPSKEKELLGKTLFFDPRLSGSGWISCATCHNPGLSWSDGLPKSLGEGMKTLDRRTPTLLNIAFGDRMMWDGRAKSLEDQSLGPIQSSGEMNGDLQKIIPWLQTNLGYRQLFARAFSGQLPNAENLAMAIAAFERTIVSAVSPFDEWIAGNEAAIPDEAKRGFDLFNGTAGCAKCHSGWNFTDDGFHDIGLKSTDPGRGRFIPVESQRFAFKTPTLRNIARRAHYMHDGSEDNLEAVIDFYNHGGDVARPSLAPEVKPLCLTPEDEHALLAFLQTLTSRDPQVSYPELPEGKR